MLYTQEEKQAVIDRVISGEPSARILADTGRFAYDFELSQNILSFLI